MESDHPLGKYDVIFIESQNSRGWLVHSHTTQGSPLSSLWGDLQPLLVYFQRKRAQWGRGFQNDVVILSCKTTCFFSNEIPRNPVFKNKMLKEGRGIGCQPAQPPPLSPSAAFKIRVIFPATPLTTFYLFLKMRNTAITITESNKILTIRWCLAGNCSLDW